MVRTVINSRRSFVTSTRLNGNIYNLDDESKYGEMAIKNRFTIVDFYADWCGPCKMLTPILEGLVQANENVDLIKVDVDEFDEIAGSYQVRAMPTVLFLRSGIGMLE